MLELPPQLLSYLAVIKYCHMSNWFWIGPTLAAILTFLGYAAFKWLQGEFNPGLSLDYRHQRVSISPSQTLFFVEVEARNSSKVPVGVRFMEVTLSRLSRYTDEEAKEMYMRSFPSDGSPLMEIPWNMIFTIPRKWEEGTLTIQPGEAHFECFEFLISSSYDTMPIRVNIQLVNKDLQEINYSNSGAVAWERVGIIGAIENGDT